MKLEQSFEVAAPIDQVWEALIDVERVAPCLPGASVTGRNEDGTYAGALTIKIGPTTAAYAGKLEMENVDESSHVATMQAQGTDKRGQGGAKATITSSLFESGEGTRVDVVTDYHITGRLARFGRGGMIEDISERLLREFAQCLQSTLTGPKAAQDAAASAAPGDGAAGAEQMPAAGAAEAESGSAESVSAESGSATEAVETSGTPPPPAQQPESQPLNAVPLMAGVVKKQVSDNKAPIGAILFGFLLAVFLLRRRKKH